MDDTSDRLESMPGAIQFEAWPTPVENDQLHLVSLRYGSAAKEVHIVEDGIALRLPEYDALETDDLEATFLSREKRAVVVFTFSNVSAFRVLDEHGLTELWQASSTQPRPAKTTFRVTGHKWQEESFLSWVMASCEFSFMIATDWECLEVVSNFEPTIELRSAVVTNLSVATKH